MKFGGERVVPKKKSNIIFAFTAVMCLQNNGKKVVDSFLFGSNIVYANVHNEKETPMTNVISSILSIEIAKKNNCILHLRMENRKSPNIHSSE